MRDKEMFWFDPDRHKLSVAEAFALRSLLRAKPWLPSDLTWQMKAGVYHFDIAIPSCKLDIEIDGGFHHNNPEVAARDAVRDAWVYSNGWEVLRVKAEVFIDKLNMMMRSGEYPGYLADKWTLTLLEYLDCPVPSVKKLLPPVKIQPQWMGNVMYSNRKHKPPVHPTLYPR